MEIPLFRKALLNLNWKIVSYCRRVLHSKGYEIRRLQGSLSNFTSQLRLAILSNCEGILHIGAHFGQEAQFYEDLNLNVIWIEGDPTTYATLKSGIKSRVNQNSYLALLGNIDSRNVNFYRTSNEGQSSSVYPLVDDLGFKSVIQEDIISLPMITLDSLFPDEKLRQYPYWLLDVQGAELLVLKGATRSLRYCKFLEVEVSTFPLYKNQPLFKEVTHYLANYGFFPIWEPRSRFHGNVIYLRKSELNFIDVYD